MSALLEVRDLHVEASGRILTRGLDFTVRPGETWAVVGANGAGKTMLLRTLAGLRAPKAGTVRYGTRDAFAITATEAARCRAYLPQVLSDAFASPVLDVVMLGSHASGGAWRWPSAADVGRAREALAQVDARELGSRQVTQLSGGERQRVGIATMLVQSAPLMLLDEPIAHLDVSHAISILSGLSGLAATKGRALMFSVHDVTLAARFATHVLLFRGGGRIDAGPGEAILDEAAVSQALGHPMKRGRVGGSTVFVPA